MSMDQDQSVDRTSKKTIKDNTNPLAASVMSRRRWGERVLSPWVQRSLGNAVKQSSSYLSRTPLTVTHTSTLLNRLQRTADKSTVWQPNVGSVNPLMVDRFSTTIANRINGAVGRDREQPVQRMSVESTDLTLAGTIDSPSVEEVQPEETLRFSVDEVRRALDWKSGGDIWASSPETPSSSSEPPTSSSTLQRRQSQPKSDASLPFSLAEVRAAFEKPHFTRSSTTPHSPTSPIQRASHDTTQSPAPSNRASLPRRRLHSRVEEVTPDQAGKPPQPSPVPNFPPPSPVTPPSPSISPSVPVQRQPVDSPEAPGAKLTPESQSSMPSARPSQPPNREGTIQRHLETEISAKTSDARKTPDQTDVDAQSIDRESPSERRSVNAPSVPKIDDVSTSTELEQTGLGPHPEMASTSKPTLQRQPEQDEVSPAQTPASPPTSGESSSSVTSSEPEMPLGQMTSPKTGTAESDTGSNIQRQADPKMPLRETRRGQPTTEKLPSAQDDKASETSASSSSLQKTVQRRIQTSDVGEPSAPSAPSKLTVEEQDASTSAVELGESDTKSVDEMPLVQKRTGVSSSQQSPTKTELPTEPITPSRGETLAPPKGQPDKSSGGTPSSPIVQTKAVMDKPVSSRESKQSSEPTTQSSPVESMPLKQSSIQRSTTAQSVDEPPAVHEEPPLSEPEDTGSDVAKSAETIMQPQLEIPSTASLDVSDEPAQVQRKPGGDDQIEPSVEPVQPVVGSAEDGPIQHQLEPDLPLLHRPISLPGLAQRLSATDEKQEDNSSIDVEATAGKLSVDAQTSIQRQVDDRPETMEASKPTDTSLDADFDIEPERSSVQPDVVQRQSVDEVMPLRRDRSVPSDPKSGTERTAQPGLETFTEQPKSSPQAGSVDIGETRSEKQPAESSVQRQPLEEIPAPKPTTSRQTPPQDSGVTTPSEEASKVYERPVDHSGDQGTLPLATASTQSPVQRQPMGATPQHKQTPPQRSEPSSTLVRKTSSVEETAPASSQNVVQPVSSEQAVDVQSIIQRRPVEEDDLPLHPDWRQPSRAIDAPDIDLNKNILAKADIGSRLPLTKPLSGPRSNMTQTKSAVQRMAALPQVRPDEDKPEPEYPATLPNALPISRKGAVGTSAEDSTLPLAPPVRIEVVPAKQHRGQETSLSRLRRSSASPLIQRQPISQTTTPSGTVATPSPDVIQRANEGETVEPPAQPAAPPTQAAPAADLDKLARQILPEIKRMLARERDRLSR